MAKLITLRWIAWHLMQVAPAKTTSSPRVEDDCTFRLSDGAVPYRMSYCK